MIVTYFDILPTDINNLIWNFVYQSTLNKIKEFAIYKKTYQNIVRAYINEFIPLASECAYFVIFVYINDYDQIAVRLSPRWFDHFIKLVFKEVESGNTCGIFNPNIINSGLKMYKLIGGSELYPI